MYHVIKNKENLIHDTEDHPGKAKRKGKETREGKNIRRKYKVVVCTSIGLPSEVGDKGQKQLFIPAMIRWSFPVGPGPRLHSKVLCMKGA